MTLIRYIRTFVVRLGVDFPGTYKDVLRLIGNDVWRIAVESEKVNLQAIKGMLVASSEDGRKAKAQCSITLRTLRGLMHSELTVVSALATEQLVLKGDVDSLLRFSEALHLMFDSIPRSRGLETVAFRFWRGHGIDRKGRATHGRQLAPRKTYRFGLIPVLDNYRMEGHYGYHN